VKTAWQKKIVSIAVALALAAIVVVFYYAITKEPVTDWCSSLSSRSSS